MKITVKSVNKTAPNMEIDVEKSDTILQVKEKIQVANPDWDASTQKLICAGKILQNTKTVEESALKETDFLVVIPGKKAAAAATPAAAPAAATTTTSSAAAEGASAENTNSTNASADGSSAATAATNNNSAPLAAPAVSTSEEANRAIDQLVEMGFPREQCQLALRASFGNPDRAVEYLMTGEIPDVDAVMGQAAQAAAAAGGQGTAAAPAAGGAAAPAAGNMDSTAFPSMSGGGEDELYDDNGVEGGDDPMGGMEGMDMGQLQAMLQQNPQMMQAMIGEMVRDNPEMAQQLASNPQAFMQLLGQMGGGAGGMPPGAGGAPGAEGGAAPPGQVRIALSPEDQAAVERLEQLGFPRAAVVQAYIAADKNEELAANLLFDMGDDL